MANGTWITLKLCSTTPDATVVFEVDLGALVREADFFTQALRYRDRWRHGHQSRGRMRDLARGSIELELSPKPSSSEAGRARLGDPETSRRAQKMFEREDVVELVLPPTASGALLAFPWEYVFSAAYRSSDDAPHALLVRRLDFGVGRRGGAPMTRGKVLYCELTPGAIQDLEWTFRGERTIARSFGTKDTPDPDTGVLSPPEQETYGSLASITRRAKRTQPWLVHIAGFDAAHAHGELTQKDIWPRRESEASEVQHLGEVPVLDPKMPRRVSFASADQLAQAVTAGARKPRLVVATLYDSQVSLAARCVQHGAGLAIGIQDHADDAVIEIFVRELYARLAEGTFTQAFRDALGCARLLTPSFHGTGLVCYTRASLLGPRPSERRFLPTAAASRARPPSRRTRAQNTSSVEPEVVPQRELNFAMLNNGASIFERFYLKRQSDPAAMWADVDIVLRVGGDGGLKYSETLALEPTITDLTRNVKVPITWLRDRMPAECINTTIDVTVTYSLGKTKLPGVRQSLPVTLLPPDSWKDDDRSRQWLPTFVLPRDPAVRRVLDVAQRHLDVLSGQALSGFDGYQSIDEEATNPFAGVDKQAEAVWNGFVVDLDLRYVNPPPSYQDAIQRIRTPSGVLRDRRGTCIDLALFYASCLEMIGIWPAVFLLEGHCFVGYWRSEEGLFEFLEDAYRGGVHDASVPALSCPTTGAGWLFGKEYYAAIRNEVHHRKQLVPLEATMLTSRTNFATAVGAGKENLRSKAEFHSMMDVWAARDQRVTPLPFLEATMLRDDVGGVDSRGGVSR